MEKLTTILLLLLSFTLSYAQQTPAEKDCFERLKTSGNARALRGMCDHVITPDFLDGQYSYVTKFKQAAGVTEEDSEEEVYRKIRKVWDEYEDCLTCHTIAFALQGGNILKAATVSLNETFYKAVIKWGVNLNRIDPVDGKTVLDFLQDKLAKNPPNIEFYRAYYQIFKEHGAKHAAEILSGK